MPEAWVVREIGRQELLRDLMRQVYDQNDLISGNGNHFMFNLGTVILYYLHTERHLSHLLDPEAFTEKGEKRWFNDKVWPRINSFSRTRIEQDALIATFLEKHLLPALLRQFSSELQRQEFEEPERIFKAKGAMEEVPFPEEEN